MTKLSGQKKAQGYCPQLLVKLHGFSTVECQNGCNAIRRGREELPETGQVLLAPASARLDLDRHDLVKVSGFRLTIVLPSANVILKN